MVVVVWRVLNLEDDLHERKECPVIVVQLVEVLASQKLDLVDPRPEVLPLGLVNADLGCCGCVQSWVYNPILDSAVIIGFAHGKRCFWGSELVSIFGAFVSDERPYVVNGTCDAFGGLAQASIQNMASNRINRHGEGGSPRYGADLE